MKAIMRMLAIISLFCVVSSVCWADIVYLKDGQVLRGDIVSQDRDSVVIETYGGTTETIDREYISSIAKDESYQSYRRKMRTGYMSGNQWYSDEWIFKIGFDFNGQHETSNSNLSIEGVGNSSVNGTQNVDSGMSFGGEYVSYISRNVGFGGGLTAQFDRALTDMPGNFSFTPIYGLVKVRTTPVGRNVYEYLIGQIGYNFFTGDIDYTGRNGSLDGGLYFGVGAGIAINRIQFELLYTQDNGSVSNFGYTFNPQTNQSNYFTESGDIRYSKLGITVGFIF
jgi:hypothetical protein